MRNKLLKLSLFLLLGYGGNLSANAANKSYFLSSPDGKLRLEVLTDGQLSIQLLHGGDTLLSRSPIGLVLADGTTVGKDGRISGVKRRHLKEEIQAPFYRQRSFTMEANEMELRLQGGFSVTFRATDEGVAYRFGTTRKGETVIQNEIAEFRFPGDPTAYLPYSTNDREPLAMAYQNFYDVTPLSKAQQKLAFLPVTLDIKGVKLTLTEADLNSYPGMFVQIPSNFLDADNADNADKKIKSASSVSSASENLSVTGLQGVFAPYPAKTDHYPWRKQEYVTERTEFIARSTGARSYPWRVLAVAERDTQMPVNNLVYALSAPNRIGDTSWIRPGKVAWEWWNDLNLKGVPFRSGINMDTYKYYIDFAGRNGIEYVVLDEGWYAPASGDMLTVIPELNLSELISYGKERNVGIVLWTVFNVLDSQLEEACSRYAAMGIKGFKVDFLDRDDQTAVEMVERIAETAARHHLFLDLHGIYKPVGLNRTYPNILNFESVFGMEEMKWSDPKVDMPLYDVTFPYIRMMAGPVDYTPGAMRNATRGDWHAAYHTPMSMGTRCHQLAAYIVHDSPFTMFCDSPTNYEREQECVSFIASLPVEADSTFIADGLIGEYIVTVRQKDGNWYVGGMTNWDSRDVELDFSFLPAGRSYTATLFADGINADHHAEDYRTETLTLTRDSRLKIHLAPGGGFAMKMTNYILGTDYTDFHGLPLITNH